MRLQVRQVKASSIYFQRIEGIDPGTSPEAVSAALREMMETTLERARRGYLSGPRPRHLDQVTGELAGSLAIDDSSLPHGIRGGTPLSWAPVHEFGRSGARAFLGPAIVDSLPRFPEILERRLLAAFDRGSR